MVSLASFDLEFRGRSPRKAQGVADFLLRMEPVIEEEEEEEEKLDIPNE